MSEEYCELIIYVKEQKTLEKYKQIFCHENTTEVILNDIGGILVENFSCLKNVIFCNFMAGSGFSVSALRSILEDENTNLSYFYYACDDFNKETDTYCEAGKRTTKKRFFNLLIKNSPEAKLYLSVQDKKLDEIKILLEKKNVNADLTVNGLPLLFHLIYMGNLSLVKLAVKAGANVNCEVLNENWLDHNKIGKKYTPLFFGIRLKKVPIVKFFLSLGVNVNHKDAYGNAPIHIAAMESESHDIIESLISHGADINDENDEGNTPLFLLAMDRTSSIKHITTNLEKAVEYGAKLNYISSYGGNLLWAAKGSSRVEEYVISLGIKEVLIPDNAYNKGLKADIYHASYKNDLDNLRQFLKNIPQLTQKDQSSMLVNVINSDRLSRVKMLVEAGVKPYSKYRDNGVWFYAHELAKKDSDIKKYLVEQSQEHFFLVEDVKEKAKEKYKNFIRRLVKIRKGKVGSQILSELVSDELKDKTPLSDKLVGNYPNDNWERLAFMTDRRGGGQIKYQVDEDINIVEISQPLNGGPDLNVKIELKSGNFIIINAH